jgi:hypothetical protein
MERKKEFPPSKIHGKAQREHFLGLWNVGKEPMAALHPVFIASHLSASCFPIPLMRKVMGLFFFMAI